MKDIVNTPNVSSWLQLVCNMSNLTQDLKWSNKTLLKLGGASDS